MTLLPLMLWIVVSTLRNHSETNMVRVVNREKMYGKGAIQNEVKQGSEKNVGVFEMIEMVVGVLSLQVVEGRRVHWTCHLGVVRVLSKGLVKDARVLRGLDAKHLLRTSQGGF